MQLRTACNAPVHHSNMLSQIRYIKKKIVMFLVKFVRDGSRTMRSSRSHLKKIESHELLDICTITNVDKCMYKKTCLATLICE